jgi:prepilin-type N-terminal cleavage/methylation domain-containing protein/prepilin-type processing-associated H-X9-DG protein
MTATSHHGTSPRGVGRSSNAPTRARAFTLVELLVVIVIIAVLASILFPVFARARLQSKTTVCLSNLRQLGVVMQSYAEDYNDRLPVGNDVFWGDLYSLPTDDTRLLYTYLEDRVPQALWNCPADVGFRWWMDEEFVLRDYIPSTYRTRGQSYDYNLLMVWNPYTGRVDPLAVGSVRNPGSIALLKDAHFMWHNNNSPRLPLLRNPADPGGWNVLYLDGHIRRVVNTRGATIEGLFAWWIQDNNPRR